MFSRCFHDWKNGAQPCDLHLLFASTHASRIEGQNLDKMSIIDPYMNLIYLGAFLIFGAYALKKTIEYLKHYQTSKAKVTGGNLNNPLSRFDSFRDFLMNLENGLDLQAKQIAKECDKQHKNPMDDTGYTTVVKQYQDCQQWRTRLESPLGSMLDGFLYPIAKQAPNWLMKEATKLMR